MAGLHHQSSVLFGTLEGISKPIEGKQSELKLETGAGAGGAGDTGSLKVELLWPRECSAEKGGPATRLKGKAAKTKA